ncbi:MAG: hypothetical protein HY652_11325 [Acidobacteria bacterium]|nr:hypothetical protein [Acidobacteriota bacterium]
MVYGVYPSLQVGRPYKRVISRDGKPVASKELEKQDREQEKKALEQARRLERERTDQREKRLAEEAEERRKEGEATDEIFRLYDIQMAGREILDGYSAILLTFSPRVDYKPRTDAAKILKKWRGRAWVHEEEHQLIRAELESIDDVTLGLGLLGRLKTGAKASFQRRKVNEEIWLPAMDHFSGAGRLLLLKGFKIDATSEYSDYKKFTVETSTSSPLPTPRP